ncbi:hypothetical protein PH586_01970 [Pseudomonas sp. SA3-5]|uniref:Uncharacterized protein n=1 Tax=Pseudomonas aestuarii TaxID=3018340 RepID=A0ABT4X9U9_9PSED|nr:hypothetical protein [Pseudomonas aestuarii]MDA7085155.1 hypothetical protein [Pseudomonas aestuarii]
MKKLRILPLLVAVWALFAWASLQLRDAPRLDQQSVLRVRLPIPVQLAYAGGDPYLAANLNVFRSLMVDARISEGETYRVQGQLQADASFFNPRHEDNYYVASAILPWNGQVEAAQRVLLRAAQSREWDMWPAFFYAFNAMYFERDMARAGHWAEVAAQRDTSNADSLRAMAAKWYERGDDPQMALNILKAMREQSRDANFRALLQARMARLEGLQALRVAAAAYRAEHGAPPSRLEELLGYGGLPALPQDPLQLGYALSDDGQPVLVDHKR